MTDQQDPIRMTDQAAESLAEELGRVAPSLRGDLGPVLNELRKAREEAIEAADGIEGERRAVEAGRLTPEGFATIAGKVFEDVEHRVGKRAGKARELADQLLARIEEEHAPSTIDRTASMADAKQDVRESFESEEGEPVATALQLFEGAVKGNDPHLARALLSGWMKRLLARRGVSEQGWAGYRRQALAIRAEHAGTPEEQQALRLLSSPALGKAIDALHSSADIRLSALRERVPGRGRR